MSVRAKDFDIEINDVSNEIIGLASMLTERIKRSIKLHERVSSEYEFEKVEYDYNGGDFKLNIIYKKK